MTAVEALDHHERGGAELVAELSEALLGGLEPLALLSQDIEQLRTLLGEHAAFCLWGSE